MLFVFRLNTKNDNSLHGLEIKSKKKIKKQKTVFALRMITFVWKRIANYRIYIAHKNHRTVAVSAVVSPLNGNNNTSTQQQHQRQRQHQHQQHQQRRKKVVGVYLEDLVYRSCMRCGSQHLWCCLLSMSLSVLRGSLSTLWPMAHTMCLAVAHGRARECAYANTQFCLCVISWQQMWLKVHRYTHTLTHPSMANSICNALNQHGFLVSFGCHEFQPIVLVSARLTRHATVTKCCINHTTDGYSILNLSCFCLIEIQI